MKKTTPTIEIVEPKELTRFQPAKQSVKSEYRLGNPVKPKKCWGKKVKLTPMNITQKCALPYSSL